MTTDLPQLEQRAADQQQRLAQATADVAERRRRASEAAAARESTGAELERLDGLLTAAPAAALLALALGRGVHLWQ